FWSLDILLDELRTLYLAERVGLPASLPPLSVQYIDYVSWQADMLAGPEGERHWEYWRQQLAGRLPILDLPTDRPRPPIQTYPGFTHTFELDKELARRLQALAKAEGATLYMILLAAFQVLLHRYTGQEDILLGSPTVNRSRAELENVVGCFTNPVVLRA